MIELVRTIAMCLFTLMNFVGAFKEGAGIEGFDPAAPLKDYTFLTVLGIVLCFLIIFIFSSAAERRLMLSRIGLLTPIFIFVVYMGILQLCIGSEVGLIKLINLVTFVVPACCLFVGLFHRPKDLASFLWFIVVFGSFMSSIAFIFNTQNPFYFLSSGSVEGRSWTYIMYGALACSAGLIAFIWSVETVGKIPAKVIFLSVSMLNFAGVIYSSERGSILFVPFIMIIYLFMSGVLKRLASSKLIWITVVIGILAVAGMQYFQSDRSEAFRQRFLKLGLSGGGVEKDNRLDVKGEYFEGFFNAVNTNPLFGVGPGNYFGFNQGAYPHNLILETAGELGLIGLMLYLFILKRAWSGVRKGMRMMRPHIYYAHLSITALYFFRTFKTGNLVGSRYFWLLIASWLVFAKIRQSSASGPSQIK